MKVDAFLNEVEKIVDSDSKSIVIYSAIWPLIRLTGLPAQELVPELCYQIMARFSGLTLLMPTFTSGYDKSGVCNLDLITSKTGILTEHFRKCEGVTRTCSAFFSFATYGPRANELASLRPQESWGEGSVYEWMSLSNTEIITIGLHPTHCSFSHYSEWLNRDIISYRMNIQKSGLIIKDGTQEIYSEVLFSRKNSPKPINDFTKLLSKYLSSGMKISKSDNFIISSMKSRSKLEVLNKALNDDPLSLISNREDFQ